MAFASALIVAGYSCCGAAIEATLLVPKPGKQVSGPKVEIAVGYNTGSVGSVTRMELSVDGAQSGSKVLDTPKNRGVASFLWDSRQVTNGKHKFQVTIYGGDKILGTVAGSLTSSNDASSHGPVVQFANLKSGSVISGTANVKIEVTGIDSSATVGLLVDKVINGMTTAPYEFDINTAKLSEGRHVLDAYALDGAGNRIQAQPLDVVVQNKPAAISVASAPPKSIGKNQVSVTVKPVPKKIAPPVNKTPASATAAVTTAKPPVVKPTIKPDVNVASVRPRDTVPFKTAKVAPAKTIAPDAPTKAAAARIAKAPLRANSAMTSAKAPSVPTTEVEPVTTKVTNTFETPDKTDASVTQVKPNAASAQAPPKLATTSTTAKPTVEIKPVRTAKATIEPVTKTPTPVANTVMKTQGTPLSRVAAPARPSDPPVKMAWTPPAIQKATVEHKLPVSMATPKPEPQDTVPAEKATPAPPRVAKAATPNEVKPSPAVAKPMVIATAPTPKPVVPPIVAKATIPTPKAVAPPVVAKVVRPTPKPFTPPAVAKVATPTPKPIAPPAVKPRVVAKATIPVATGPALSAAETQRATSKMMDVSLRWALQMAGLNVSFADDGRVIRGSDGSQTIEFQVGAREVLVGDHVVVLPSPVTSVGGRAMIPLSFIVEQLGLALKDPSLMKPQTKAN